jgi:hypothetical protein
MQTVMQFSRWLGRLAVWPRINALPVRLSYPADGRTGSRPERSQILPLRGRVGDRAWGNLEPFPFLCLAQTQLRSVKEPGKSLRDKRRSVRQKIINVRHRESVWWAILTAVWLAMGALVALALCLGWGG